MGEKNIELGVLRKYYYDKYQSLQYQLMVIAGGTLTVFISINKNDAINLFYKRGFVSLGISLIFGVLSLTFFQIFLIFFAESNSIFLGLLPKNKKEEVVINYLKKRVKNGFFDQLNIAAGFLQLIFFITGLIIITIGLIKS